MPTPSLNARSKAAPRSRPQSRSRKTSRRKVTLQHPLSVSIVVSDSRDKSFTLADQVSIDSAEKKLAWFRSIPGNEKPRPKNRKYVVIDGDRVVYRCDDVGEAWAFSGGRGSGAIFCESQYQRPTGDE